MLDTVCSLSFLEIKEMMQTLYELTKKYLEVKKASQEQREAMQKEMDRKTLVSTVETQAHKKQVDALAKRENSSLAEMEEFAASVREEKQKLEDWWKAGLDIRERWMVKILQAGAKHRLDLFDEDEHSDASEDENSAKGDSAKEESAKESKTLKDLRLVVTEMKRTWYTLHLKFQ